MSEDHPMGNRGDRSTKWLVGGVLAGLGTVVFFLAFMSDMIRSVEGAAGGRLLALSVLGVGMFMVVALGPIGRAIGKRILEGGGGAGDDLGAEVQELRLQTKDLRSALAEAQERLDFTERMLAGGKERVPEELH